MRPGNPKARNVLMITPGGLEHGGGIGRMAGYMLDAWSDEPDRPDIKILDSRGPGHIALSPLYLGLCLLRMILEARRSPLLHIHLAGRGSTVRKLVVARLGRLLGMPVVLHLHDYNYRESLQRFPEFVRQATVSMFSKAQQVVVLSKADRALAIEALQVAPERVEVVPNAVPALTPAGQEERPPGPCRILFLGNPSRRKGVHDLIDALASKPMSSLAWEATIAGGGDQVTVFKNQAERVGLKERVSFPGWLDRPSTTQLLRSSDILVLPSYDEGMAMSVLEGISCGLCVICTPVGGLVDVVEDNISGVVIQPGDVAGLVHALVRCVSNPAERVRLGAGAVELFARRFDVRQYPKQMERIYEASCRSLYSSRGSPRSFEPPPSSCA